MKKHYNLQLLYGNNPGIVLLTTIIMMVILSTLILSILQGVCSFWKTANVEVKLHQALYRLELVSDHFNQLIRNTQCIINNPDQNFVLKQKTVPYCTVTLNGSRYHYLISKMKTYPCLQLKKNHAFYGSQHWLLTVFTPDYAHGLQLRFAKPVHTEGCLQSIKPLKKSRLSWRYLPRAST
jgi:hypothetical protein